ncbi:N-acetylmuramidase family protein [Rubrolithibacter danxiaensis]|uniref:N-acetylmuramidase family protein n=1 Tax=Rubrolithibacter danxiaensis TaxID=3390805 RepID=UPI003BF7FED2
MITEEMFHDVAQSIDCDVAAIKAVSEVESSGSGFLKSGKVRVLFEGHVFHKYTHGKYDKSHPTLSYPKWTSKYYVRGEAEYHRFSEAFRLDKTAAMFSCSWGRFQIMGFNFSLCGFKKVGDFVDFLKVDEKNHLEAFCRYVQSVYLGDELREHRWKDFARKYNGPLYEKNQYDKKLLAAYLKYSNPELLNPSVVG